jgi:hypothetical protein
MQRVCRCWLEFGEAQVEGARRLALGVNEQGANSDLLACANDPQQGILDQTRPKSSTLLTYVDPKPRQDGHRNRMAAGSALDPSRSAFAIDGAGCQRMVADNAARAYPAYDVDAAGAGLLGLEGMFPQPVGLRYRSAVELGSVVVS